MMDQRKVVFVVGATASGKSDWALRWARDFSGVIVNCDSIQIYKKLDIGAAKPSVQERSLLPHYLFDYVSYPEEMTAGVFARDFESVLESIPTSKPVFLVGGTGFYFMAIEKGLYPVRSVPLDIQKEIQVEILAPGGAERLYRELLSRDPEYAKKVKAADHYRIARACELMRSEGRSVTEIQAEFAQQQKKFPHHLLKVGPRWEKEDLHLRIAQRTKKMLEAGLIREVQGLLDEGLEGWAPLRSVGYRETIAFLKDRDQDLGRLEEEISLNTRQLAKKQRTWFQRDSEVQWFSGAEGGFAQAHLVVEKFLNS